MDNIPTHDITEIFGQHIHTYTRREAVEDGVQVDATSMAKEAGIRFPVYLTNTVFETCVEVPEGVSGQDESGRLWDVLTMLRHALRKARPGQDRLTFALYVRNNNRAANLHRLQAVCGPTDIDDPRPAITVMLPGED